MRLDLGIDRVRRRQRGLARVVLALFCLAWLQAAALPCAMATPMPSGQDCGHPCPYCPQPVTGSVATDHAGSCAYPHQPQADARDAGVAFIALPATRSTDTLQPMPAVGAAPAAAARDPAPPVPIPVQYCRFLE
ncbi:MAG: hypothetical protein U1F09_04900 [Steroidobacteraceae bacterium]